ncbi:hypothetical protein PoB_004384400 [Plakobranchus ocellatus]|uniref:Uncharacterized protein n=1 Tax=Plakobranchus ocellatus TaxID=259542 RepID=A0AAV4BG64_9GAST|nr:hypothetical protein PoB_004384400 [Plakobranchus ocellatus]
MSEEITPVLKSIQETLNKLETRISVLETDKESESRPVQPNATEGGFATDSTWSRFRSTDDTVSPSDTVRSRAPLASVPPGSISPTEQFSAADIQRDFERIRDSLVRIPVPTGLKEAGLGPEFTARCFRPTGATAAVLGGVAAHTARSLGRWKTDDVFFNRYVFPLDPDSITDKMFSVKLT